MNRIDIFYRYLTEFEVTRNNLNGHGCIIKFRSYTEFAIELTVLESYKTTDGTGIAQGMIIKLQNTICVRNQFPFAQKAIVFCLICNSKPEILL